MIKRGLKYIIAAAVMAVVALCAMSAYACTAVYVGSDASDDGTAMLAKSNDFQHVWANYVEITPRIENEPGRTMPVDIDKKVYAELPDTTYRYTSTPMMDSAVAANKLARDAAICTNEYGVAMLMSITAFSNDKALAADTPEKGGISEFTAVDLVVCQSKTAREGVEVLCSLIDKYGSSEVNIALIADQKEVWYIEMYTAHQYAAVKLPSNKVGAFGNEFLLERLSDYEDSITSKEFESLAEENGFAVYDNGELNLRETYSGQDTVSDYSHMRTWMAQKLLAPSKRKGYDKTDNYPLCFKADKKVSLTDVMQIMRNRFEGTKYNPEKSGRTDMRVIGTEIAINVHIAQIYPDLPADMSCVTWHCTGPATCGVFVPVSNAALSVSEPYGANQSSKDKGVFDTDNYPYYRFKALTTLAAEKGAFKIYAAPVRKYWKKAEAGMTKGMKTVLTTASGLDDSELAHQYITNYCNKMQQQAFDDSGALLNDVIWYMSENSNSMKNGRNPETREVLDELKEIDPMKVKLNASAYSEIPEVGEKVETSAESEQGERSYLPLIIAAIAALAGVAVIIWCITEMKKSKSRKRRLK